MGEFSSSAKVSKPKEFARTYARSDRSGNSRDMEMPGAQVSVALV